MPKTVHRIQAGNCGGETGFLMKTDKPDPAELSGVGNAVPMSTPYALILRRHASA